MNDHYVNQNKIRIAVLGDLCPSGPLVDNIHKFKPIREEIGSIDLVIANLECPLTHSDKKIDKIGSYLKAPPEAVNVLTKLGIDVVTLANNHILDYGEEGLYETIEVLKTHGIEYVGAGMNLDEARKIFYKKLNGKTIAIINVCEREFNIASKTHGGANPLDLIWLIEDINVAKKKSDHVFVILHGGLEYTHYPSPQSVRLLRFIAEQGVSAVLRHHPHWIQGVENWSGTPIFYSLGNFIVPWMDPAKKTEQSEGILASLSLDNSENYWDAEIFPFEWDSQLNFHFIEGKANEEFHKRFDKWSQTLKDEYELNKIWEETFIEKLPFYFANLLSPCNFFLRVIRRLGLIGFLRPPKRFRLLLQNFIQCEAHREAIISALLKEWEKTIDVKE